MCLKITIRKILFNGNGKNWDQIIPSNSPRARGTTPKFRKERIHREEFFKSVNLMSAIRVRPDLRKEHETKPCNKKDAPAEQHGHGEKCLKAENTDKATFYCPIEAKATPAPTSKSPEEREFVVDFRASMHMRTRLQFHHLESFAKNMDIPMSVSAAKSHT